MSRSDLLLLIGIPLALVLCFGGAFIQVWLRARRTLEGDSP